ncbi:MAG: low molecular weight phosphotyrosine protein phosphatase [Chitinophagaceae bacterium]|nr:MAG: low molecular weight phosphotyrosine protein phosphatase [Chitinophagaceae bacterium]
MKILMVCLGNICRSPLAEGILKSKIDKDKLSVEVDSAGTSAYHSGEKPDPRSIEVANKYNIDISNQKARQFSAYDFEVFDKIYVMDSSNYMDVIKLANSKGEEEKVMLIMNEAEPGRNINVPDPYWDNDGFEQVYRMLDRASDEIINKIKTKKL